MEGLGLGWGWDNMACQTNMVLTILKIVDLNLANIDIGDSCDVDGCVGDILATILDLDFVVSGSLWGVVGCVSTIAIVGQCHRHLLDLWSINSWLGLNLGSDWSYNGKQVLEKYRREMIKKIIASLLNNNGSSLVFLFPFDGPSMFVQSVYRVTCA